MIVGELHMNLKIQAHGCRIHLLNFDKQIIPQMWCD